MFLFSPEFDWNFSHLPKFNWASWTLPKCSYYTQLFLILPKTLSKFFSWPTFDEGCWNYHMIPVHSRAVFVLPSGAKNGKIVPDYFAVLAINLPLMWLLFCLSLENRHYLITYECSCILCPNLKIFARIMSNFSALGMWPHPLHPHAVRLWVKGITSLTVETLSEASFGLTSWGEVKQKFI